MGSLLAWTAGGVAAIGAKAAYAYVEGVAFIFSKPAAVLVAVAELGTFVLTAGLRLPLRVAASTLLAAGTLRGLHHLMLSLSHPGMPDGRGGEALSSIWDWEPPAGSDGSQFSAWHILRQLALTANKVKASNPGIQKLLDQPCLAPAELGMRLYYFYITSDERPMLDDAQLAACAPGSSRRAAGGGAPPGGDDSVMPVPEDLLEQVRAFRAIACLPYYFNTDEGLAKELASRSYTLLSASHTSDLSSGCPAYFLAISEGQQEVMLVIRGTFSPEDAFLDLLATGVQFDEDKEQGGCHTLLVSAEAEQAQAEQRHRLSGHCHSGMGRGAVFLGAKFGALLLPLYAQGMRVTLVGHSLGAGVASLLAVYLRNRGLGADRLRCWAYEAPACMDLDMALAASDVVTSLVHADDVVPRLNIRSFAGLLEELAAFDWRTAQAAEEAAAVDGDAGGGRSVAKHLVPLLSWALNRDYESSSGEETEQKGEEEEEKESVGASEGAGASGASAANLVSVPRDGFDQPYNAHVPGQVVLLYRTPCSMDNGSGEFGKGGECKGLALVACTHPAVRRMRVSSRMITDHFVDSAEVVGTLGG